MQEDIISFNATHPHGMRCTVCSEGDRLSMSHEILDEGLASKIMPGKMKITDRQRHLDALEFASYIGS